MVDGVLNIKRLEYQFQDKEMYVDMDATPKKGLYFNNKKFCFDAKEDDLLDDEEEVYMINTRGYLQHE